jgi:ribosomal protein S18 acetylase RimI-like enzyme
MEQPPIVIAPAAPGDEEWCARLMAASEPWITLRRDLSACRASLTRPDTELFVARENGRAVGFLLVSPHGFASSPYVASIAVASDARGRGIGSALLRFAERHFVGRRHLFLLVSSFNDRAHELYRRVGYERIGELKDYVVPGASEIILHKWLV